MNSINKNGCSVCQPGKENYCTYNNKLRGKRVRMYQYDYRTEEVSGFLVVRVPERRAEKDGING